MISEQELVEVFRIIRHDWLNQLQLIKANLSLNRSDRIEAIINKIVEESHSESNLSNLKATHLTSFLLLHKTLNKDYTLHIEVEPLGLDLSDKDEAITKDLEILFSSIPSLTPATALDLSLYKSEHNFYCSLEFPNPGISEAKFKEGLEAFKFVGNGTLECHYTGETISMCLGWKVV